jgi:hypothetical protein
MQDELTPFIIKGTASVAKERNSSGLQILQYDRSYVREIDTFVLLLLANGTSPTGRVILLMYQLHKLLSHYELSINLRQYCWSILGPSQ